MTTGEVVFETKRTKIVRSAKRIEMIIYPMPGYGNNHGWVIEVNNDTVELIKFCHAWATGPCRGMDDWVTVAEIEDPEFAREVEKLIGEVKNVDDFNRLIALIEKRQEELDNKAREKFNELVDAFTDLVYKYEEKETIEELLEDKEKLRELVKEFIEDYLARELSDC